jgi:Cu(I)/Ag(I) efflux system membrane fusion protein
MYHQHARPVVDGYLEFTKALVADDAAGAKVAISSLRKALKGVFPHGLEAASAELFKKQIAALESSLPPANASVEDARNKLPDVTRRLTEYLKTFGHDRAEPIVAIFCSMAFDDKGAKWLQADQQVRNPYFGKKMLRCGEVQELIGPNGSVTKHE